MTTSDLEVHFTITGPGDIIGVGNGDIKSLEAHQGSQRKTYEESALVVVRGRMEAGANADGVPSAAVTVEAGP